jgi:hypothetical protein
MDIFGSFGDIMPLMYILSWSVLIYNWCIGLKEVDPFYLAVAKVAL